MAAVDRQMRFAFVSDFGRTWEQYVTLFHLLSLTYWDLGGYGCAGAHLLGAKSSISSPQ